MRWLVTDPIGTYIAQFNSESHANSFAYAISWDVTAVVCDTETISSYRWQYGECSNETANNFTEKWRS